MNRTFRLLRADEIEVRVGQASKEGATRPWYSLLLYKDARADMNVLDETVGAANWSRSHLVVKDVLYCKVGVRFPIFEVNDKAEVTGIKAYTDWTYKEDCGTESNTEKEKGESSDSFKRACVNWGIGRELYTAPKMFVGELLKGVGDRRSLYVSKIEYDKHDNIALVVIKDFRDETFVKTFKSESE